MVTVTVIVTTRRVSRISLEVCLRPDTVQVLGRCNVRNSYKVLQVSLLCFTDYE